MLFILYVTELTALPFVILSNLIYVDASIIENPFKDSSVQDITYLPSDILFIFGVPFNCNLPFTEGVIADGMRLEAKINQSFTKVKFLKIKGEKI